MDSCLLIAAFRGEAAIREKALRVLSEPSFEFWYSPLLRLEVLLHPSYNKVKPEIEFHTEYFKGANCFGDLNRIFEIGEPEALRHGIPVMDALHIAAANLSKCEFLVTTEKLSKPIFRTKLVQVVSISESPIGQETRLHRRLQGIIFLEDS